MAVNSNISDFSRLDVNFYKNKNITPFSGIVTSGQNIAAGQIINVSQTCISASSGFYIYTLGGVRADVINPVSKTSFFRKERENMDFGYFFNDFINTRIDYLEKLKSLGDNWMSGESKQPQVNALEFSKTFLKKLRNWFSSDSCAMVIPPKIIMSPTPTGGIAMELIFNKNLNFLLSISDDEIELEKNEDGHYSDINVSKETVLEKIIDSTKIYVLSI